MSPPLSAEAQARRAVRVLDAVSDAYVTLDRDWRIIYVNAEAARINRKPAEQFLGRIHWEEWPASVGTEFERQFRRAMTERVPVRFLERYHVPGVYDDWIDVTAYPAAEEDGGGIHLVYRDVTERVHRERREQFLASLAERARTLTDPRSILADVVRSVGQFLGLSRCTFVDFDRETDICTIDVDYCADDSVASVLPWSVFGTHVIDALGAGHTVVVNDVRDDSAQMPAEYATACETIGVRAHITVPAVGSTQLVSCLSAQNATPRYWKPEEIELLRSVVERTWLTVEVARQRRALQQEVEQRREQGEYLRRLIESSPDCIKTMDLDGTILTISESGLRLMEIGDAATVCGTNWADLFWEYEETQARFLAARDIARAGGTGHFQGFCPTTSGRPKWWDVVIAPILGTDGQPEQLLSVSRDITAQHEAEERERFLSELTARTRALLDPEEVLYEMARSVGEYTKAHRALYIEIDDVADTLTVRRDFVAEGVASIAGTYPLDSFGPLIIESLRAGNITQVTDTEQDPRLEPDHRATFRALDFRAFLAVPLHRAGRWVAVLAIHYARPRWWTVDEAELLTAVMERTWLAVENALLFHETRRRAEREALLNRIGAAVRSALEPDDILQAAVNALGQGMQADRCYFVRYNQARDQGTITAEWFRADAGLEPIAGIARQMSLYPVSRDGAFKEGRRQLVNDTMAYAPNDAAPLLELQVRALLRVPIEVGDQMTALGVAMACGPRYWTEEEVRLVENVAILLRSALESAYIQQRERNIAHQLQEALHPPPPSDLPGMQLASYYRPALEEAGVGGDFFDVFLVQKSCTALVVADLSGKGLAAAQQVATVKNMLRFALYSGRSVADAVTLLHHTLVQNDLLTGFATLFVGLYDHADRTLTYVNCGQEPGLICRGATGDVEPLASTGPVLGGFGEGNYAQQTVALRNDDVLALFTDGLTEVGPDRKNLLEVEGVSELLRGCCAASPVADPHAIVAQVIARVDDFARGGVRDDIALLIGVVRRMEEKK